MGQTSLLLQGLESVQTRGWSGQMLAFRGGTTFQCFVPVHGETEMKSHLVRTQILGNKVQWREANG